MSRFYDSRLADTHRFWLLRPWGVAGWTNSASDAAHWFARGDGYEAMDRWVAP